MFSAEIWVPVLRDIVASAAPIAFVIVFVRLGFDIIVRAASGERIFK